MTKKNSNEAWQRLCLVLKAKAEAAGITHEQISYDTGIARANVTRILNGDYVPKTSTLIGICSVIDGQFLKKFDKLINDL